MGGKRFNFYRFLPIQLFFLHFRKYQLLLVFWLVLFATVTSHFMSNFGAASLFLVPEYLGSINILSFSLLGGALAIFIMSWHITTFIIHSNRVPFLGATRHAFVIYCINNSLLPLIFLIVYSIIAGHQLSYGEGFSLSRVLLMLLGFYLGLIFTLFISFLYFFRVDRNVLKTVLSSIGSLTALTKIIPFDSLDIQHDQIYAQSYLVSLTKIKNIERPYQYSNRFLNAVLRRHHRNAIFAIVFAYILLLVLGIFMEKTALRIPAGGGFLLLFSITMAFVGSFKYFLRSWEIIGWIVIFMLLSFLTKKGVFDLRSQAYGLSYSTESPPDYNLQNLNTVFNAHAYQEDSTREELRLIKWRHQQEEKKPPIIIISASGGGSRSAYWTFRCLQYADSMTHGEIFKHTALVTGASGGMIGAAFWHSIHISAQNGKIKRPYDSTFQKDIGKDLLNAIIFSMAAVDYISPYNKIVIDGRQYGKDRGYAFDKELENITGGILGGRIGDSYQVVSEGKAPLMVINGTIINDGRKLMISSQPISYLTHAQYNTDERAPVIDAIDFSRFFKNNNPMNLQLSSALRMGATFPVILPMVKLPSKPVINVMDAGLRDNFGMGTSLRYLNTFHDWMQNNCRDIIYLQIRDTKEASPLKIDSTMSLANMLLDPLFAIQKKWSAIQTFNQTYFQSETFADLTRGKFHKIVLEFEPEKKERTVALNFHLSRKDEKELRQSIFSPGNQKAFSDLFRLLSDTTQGKEIKK